MFSDGGQHGSFVQLKICCERYANELQALQLRAHGVHHKAREWTKNGGTRNITSERQQRYQFVRPIAQHDVKALRHLCIVSQGTAQVIDPAIRVTVQSQCAQPLSQMRLQRSRQAVRVFHRVQLDHAGGVLHRVGLHGLDVWADA